MANRKEKIGLALGSGGARGLAHIGVIKALEENNIHIGYIAGTSIGAFVGGLYASGMDIKSMEKIILQVDKIMVAKIMIPKLFAPGLVDNKKIYDFIHNLVGDIKIEKLRIPFACVATDLVTGQEVQFTKGHLVQAIMASIAIPIILQPVFLNGKYLLDGGLCNPLPISSVKSIGAKKIIAVNVSPTPQRITRKLKSKKTKEVQQLIKKLPSLFSILLNEGKNLFSKNELESKIFETIETESYSPTLLNVFLQSISISTNNLITQQLNYSKPQILISPQIEEFDMLEFYKGEEIIKCGFEATQNLLPEIRALNNSKHLSNKK